MFRYGLLFPRIRFGWQYLASDGVCYLWIGELMAEGVGFEPTRAMKTPLVFETSALNRSAIPPPTRKTGYRSPRGKATSAGKFCY